MGQDIKRPNANSNVSLSIALGGQKVIREIPAQQIKVSAIDILYFVDSPSDKVVEAYTKQVGKIVLWKDAEYDKIGDWTTADVEKRIKEIYK